jgi:hypothetical protein
MPRGLPSAGVALGGPETLGTGGEEGEEKSERGERKVLEVNFAGGAAGALADGEAEQKEEVGESEKAESDPEIQQQVCVECMAVLRRVDRQIPKAVGGRDGR